MSRQRKIRRRRILRFSALATMACLATLAVAETQGLDWRLPLRHLFPALVPRVASATPEAAHIVAGARSQEGTRYDAAYSTISYPNGDVPRDRGACTDVVIRALRNAGYDLQRLIHEDMKRNPAAYPRKWGLSHPDPNIDHRRALNQVVFFRRHGMVLTREVSAKTMRQWQPGDIVYWERGNGELHTGVLSDGIGASGLPLVVHNGSICVEADCLTRGPIHGHFRYPPTRGLGPGT